MRITTPKATDERMSYSELSHTLMILTAPPLIKSRARAMREFVESLQALRIPVHQDDEYGFLWRALLIDFHPEDAAAILRRIPGIEVTGGERASDGTRFQLSAVWRGKGGAK